MPAEDFTYVRFTCPACGSALQFCREGRWGEEPLVMCLKSVLGGYITCRQEFHIATRNGKVYVTTRSGRPVLGAVLTNEHPPERGEL